MGITSIKRDWGITPSIVRISTTDTLAAVETTGYLFSQSANIEQINKGAFNWDPSDSVLVYASDGSDIYSVSSDFNSLIPDSGGVTPGPYLEKANNLSDASNLTTAYQNMGLGLAASAIYNDASFPAGFLQLTNPMPNSISVDCLVPGNVLRFAEAAQLTSLQAGQSLSISNDGSEDVTVETFDGATLRVIRPGEFLEFEVDTNVAPSGVWLVTPKLYVSSAQTVYVAQDGSDSTGRGTVNEPYSTIEYALNQITDSSATKPYLVYINTGDYTETNLVLKPWIYINGNSSSLTVTGNVSLDATWSGGGQLVFENFNDSDFQNDFTLDFDAATQTGAAIVKILNVYGATAYQYNINGSTSGTTVLLANNAIGISVQQNIIVTNCFGNWSGSAPNDITILQTDSLNNHTFSLNLDTIIGDLLVQSDDGALFGVCNAVNVVGATTYITNTPGTMNYTSINTDYSGGLKVEDTTGGLLTLNIDSYTVTPVINGTPTINLINRSDGMSANVNFTPANYTPTAGANYVANSVTGNLKGIDDALAGGGGVGTSPAQVLYVSPDGNDGTGDGTIQKPYLTYETARLDAVANATAAQPYVIKIVGFIAQAGNVTISPFVGIEGNGVFTSQLSSSADIVLDGTWGLASDAVCNINNIQLAPTGDYNFTYAGDVYSRLFLQNIYANGGNFNLTGTGTAVDNPEIGFDNVIYYGAGVGTQDVIAQDVNVSAKESTFNSISCTSTSATSVNLNVGPGIFYGDITAISSGAGSVFVLFQGSVANSLTLDGVGSIAQLDASAYGMTPTFLNGATQAANILTPSLSDGIVANNNFTPVNYTPVASATYNANSVTANLAGIDAAIAAAGSGTSPAQVLYVSQDGNDGTGDGTIQKPFLTYEAARLAAVAYPATASNPFVIKLDGVFNVTGNVTISPYVSITGNGIYTSALNVTGEYNLDAAWSTETNSIATLSNFSAFTGTGFNLTYTTDRASVLIFQNMFYDGDFVLTAPGLVNAVQPLFIFANCPDISGIPTNDLTSNDVSVTCLGSGFNVTNINNAGVLNTVNFFAFNCGAILQLTLTDSGGAGINGVLNNSICASLALDGAATFLSCGAMSYPGTPAFSNGATLATNLQFPNIADGIVTNTYSPSNFTPVGNPALYEADTVQGYFEGIDNALLKPYGGFSDANGFSTTLTVLSTYYPVVGDAGGFVADNSSGVTPQMQTISGNSTPTLTYDGATTRNFMFNWSIQVRGATVTELKAKFYMCIYKADTSIVVLGAKSEAVVNNLVTQYGLSFSGVVELEQGDSLFVQVKSDVSSLVNSLYVESHSGNLLAVT